jgi:hypothetical protein
VHEGGTHERNNTGATQVDGADTQVDAADDAGSDCESEPESLLEGRPERAHATRWDCPLTSDGIECRVAGQSLKHCLNDLYAREMITVEYLMARHYARTGQPSKDCDWGHDVLAELFPDANPIWRDVDAAEDLAVDITDAWAMVIGKVGVVDALGGVVEADTFLSLRKRGSPPAQYWQKYDGEHARLEQLTAEELDIFLAVQVRSSTHIVWVLQGPAPGTAKLNELQTEIWQQSAGYIVQRAAVAAGAEAQAPVQWKCGIRWKWQDQI